MGGNMEIGEKYRQTNDTHKQLNQKTDIQTEVVSVFYMEVKTFGCAGSIHDILALSSCTDLI